MTTTETAMRRAGRTPGDSTSFVGRREAVAEVRRLLSAARLVTLTGPGGVGKSRLAAHVAQKLRRVFPDGVRLIKLAELQDESLVPSAVAAALDVPDRTMRDPETVLVEHLADRRMLLVFDSCEHLRDACGRIVALLLSAAPSVRVLATSREPLAIAGEHIWPVPPMSLPTEADIAAGSAGGFEAMRLFEDRARAVRPEFRLTAANEEEVAKLCQRLDGLPLAIELAAVLMRYRSVDEILARLEDRYRLLTLSDQAEISRHQTLRAAMDWSFDLCTQQQQALWAELSVFAGGFDIEAAEQVCSARETSPDDVFTSIARLVDKSVLTREEHALRSRYRMLSTIREFGQERLAARGEVEALRRRHRDYYLGLVRRADASWFGPDQADWLSRLCLERLNLWKALDYCLTEPGQARAGLEMAAALWFFWNTSGSPKEGRHWLERALALDPEPSRTRVKALWASGYLAFRQGDLRLAPSILEECAAMARQLGDQEMLAHGIQISGHIKLMAGDIDGAIPVLEDSLARERELQGPNLFLPVNLWRLGMSKGITGDIDRALALCEEGTALCAAQGEKWCRGWLEWTLGGIHWVAGNLDQMTAHLHECLRLMRPLQDQLNIAASMEFLAWAAAAGQQPRRAAELLGSSHALWKPLGRFLLGFQVQMRWHDECVARARRALGEQEFQAAFERGAQRSMDQIVALELEEPQGTTSLRARSESEPSSTLTPREFEVARLVARGLSNKEIATDLMISQRTAEGHIEHILAKLGFTSRTRIASWISENEE